jgi:methanogenic corrinoid protein MtbC1
MEISPTPKELIRNVHNEWFDAVGLSVSIQAQLTDLPKLISDIKKSSLNPRVALLLGGPIFTIEDFKATDFGVGGICSDAKDAVALAISLMPND